jgi:chromosome segregation ATPase
MRKHLAAFGAAAVMTACSATAILAVGGVALFNRAGVVPANSSAQSSKATDASLVSQTQVQQLQDQISQYQARDQQYQSREQQLQQALGQAQTQIQADQQQVQQFQMLLLALQQQGVITITNDGRILINRSSGGE